MKWNKIEDTKAVQFRSEINPATKREVLAKLAKVYDPLGLTSPITLQGKQIYREVCDSKVSWDALIPEKLQIRWEKWERSIPTEVTTLRPLASHQLQLQSARSEQRFTQSCGKRMGLPKPW